MNNYKKSMGLLLSVMAVSGFAFKANAASWRMIPSLTVTETYTDNVDLDSSASQSDLVTRVSPQIAITGTGSRLNVIFDYAPNYFFYPGDDDDKHDLRHTLNASLNSELISERFFVDASANIAQRFLDRRAAISSVQASRTDNRRTVQSYRFSPYLVHAFGTWATAQLRYDLSHVRQAQNVRQTTLNTSFGNSLSHQGSFSVASGSRFNRLGWTLLAQYRTEDRSRAADFETTTLNADLSYQLTDILSVLGSIGYQKRKAGSGSFANFDGFTWDAGFRLVPGPRTSLSVRYGNQFKGDSLSVDAQYKITARDSINLSYTDTIQTFQSLAFNDNSAVNLDPSLNSGFISGDLTRRKRGTFSVSGVRGRTSYSASAFYNENRSDNRALDEERYGGAFSISRRLSPRLTVSSGFSYNLSRFSSDNTDDKFWSASVSTNYQISQSLIGSLSFVHSDRDQSRFSALNGGSNFISLSIRAEI
ncbi:MAG: TIGR03016 family PEP-CTERM system-associated outer membrane protein [Alphaproteobacteria bacterium]|nr:MAG: TIGR03016 family PEP-CTERM system-associated outer membrane protein [Alphaproteobacteria bacterium]